MVSDYYYHAYMPSLQVTYIVQGIPYGGLWFKQKRCQYTIHQSGICAKLHIIDISYHVYQKYNFCKKTTHTAIYALQGTELFGPPMMCHNHLLGDAGLSAGHYLVKVVDGQVAGLLQVLTLNGVLVVGRLKQLMDGL